MQWFIFAGSGKIMEIISNPFFELAAILIIAAIVGLVGRLLKQPLIVAFIGVGILVGPWGLDLLESIEQVHLMAELGIAILLFVIGLKLDVKLIRSTGKVALLTGLGQVLFTSFFGYLIAIFLGFSVIASLYVAVALTFSSTIIIVKLLSDKKEIDSLHGQISIGFLIVQDIVVVLVMIFLSALGTETINNPVYDIAIVMLKGLAMIAVVGLLMRFVLPHIVRAMVHSQELLILFSISWALLLAAFGDFLGFSKEVGAFLAGISLASNDYREIISGKLTTLRDFLLLFFFVTLGAGLDLSLIGDQIRPALIFSFFVLIGNPLIVLIIMGLMGYKKRTSFLAGLAVAQISEFSLILAALGFQLGHIDDNTIGLITLVGLITIGLSTYMILYSHQIFEIISPFLGAFEKKDPHRELKVKQMEKVHFDVILFGLGRYGNNIARSLERIGRSIMGVDFDPGAVNRWKEKGRAAQLGDAEDPDLPDMLPLRNTKVIISTLADYEINVHLLKILKHHNFKGRIVLTQHSTEHAQKLVDAGAHLILFPFVDAAGGSFVTKLEDCFSKEKEIRDVRNLQDRV
jgi:Kef-type K+ transport system membrane component KefB